MKITADTIAKVVMEIENDNVELSQKFESTILKMEANIQTDIIQFNLLEQEEKSTAQSYYAGNKRVFSSL